MRIGIDIDGVIANTQPLIERYAVRYNDEVVRRGLQLHPHKGVTYEMFDWTEEENRDFCLNYLEEAVLQADLRPLALETIRDLHDAGHFIAIISSRAQPVFRTPYESTEKWLRDKGVPYDKLLVGTEEKKGPCLENKLDVLIEDENKFILGVASPQTSVIIMDHPWNQGTSGEFIVRARDWNDVPGLIEQLARNRA